MCGHVCVCACVRVCLSVCVCVCVRQRDAPTDNLVKQELFLSFFYSLLGRTQKIAASAQLNFEGPDKIILRNSF